MKMNNKGFAISGILYTLFIVFLMLLSAVLVSISFKKNVLEKTTIKLESSFEMDKVGITDAIDETNKTKIDGKYVFTLNAPIDSTTIKVECTTYLKKGTTIPSDKNSAATTNFKLIPNDCNLYDYVVDLENSSSTEPGTLVLKEIYKFKGSE